jgi:nucleoside-diphosphate-sugar epimerase
LRRIGKADLEHVLHHTKDIWEEVRGKSIFITGATGFFGKWLLETFLYVNQKLNLNASICALSRNPDKFLQDFPFYTDEASIKFIKGNIQDFEFPQTDFQYIIHAATDADAKLNIENPLLMLETITIGTKHILEFAKNQKSLQAFLLTSSGAVYGKQPFEVTHIKETSSFFIDINNPSSAYAEGKRLAELYCAIYNKQFGIPTKIARCFAFVGPYLPLDKHFAIGNFILNGLNKESILVKGDGTAFRSYLYASELAVALWTILLKGRVQEPYNVGSDDAISIKQLAETITKTFGNSIKYHIAGKPSNKPPERYVPNISHYREMIKLQPSIAIEEALQKTKLFHMSGE